MKELTDAFDPQKLESDFYEIRSIMSDAMLTATHVFEDFETNLSRVWASQNAIDFVNSLRSGSWGSLTELWHDRADNLRAILINSYNAWANANQLSAKADWPYIGSDAFLFTSDYGHPFTTEINGKVGMNKAEVQNIISNFETIGKQSILSKLDLFPSSIAVYDAGSMQNQSYSKSIERIKSAIEEAIGAAVSSARSYIDKEINNVALTIEQSSVSLDSQDAK